MTQHIDLQRLAREFVERELMPTESIVEETNELPETIWKKMRNAGFFGITLPEQYGGAGASLKDYAAVVKEFGRTNWGFFGAIDDNNGMGSELILQSGSAELKDRILPELASGRALACFALTEPEAGSDASGIRTTARRHGNYYTIDGTKRFISNACKCSYFTVVTRSSSDTDKGYTAFLVERDAPGFTIGSSENLMGWRGACQHELIFNSCRVSAQARLGDEGGGLDNVFEALKVGRMVVAAWALGAANRALSLGVQYAANRRQFGRPIGAFQGVQWLLADSAVELSSADALLDRTLQKFETEGITMRDAAMTKLAATEMASRVADNMIQVHGGIGLSKDLPLERILRDVRACRIIEGTSEIQRSIIAKGLLKMAGMDGGPH